jgi:hypothetical protein
MADAITPTSHLRGVLVHDERISSAYLDATRTTATEAGPLPDTPVPDALGFLELEALGVYTDETDVVSYNVACKKPGAPTVGTPGGSLVYRRSGASSWIGWHAPNVITGVSVPVSSSNPKIAGVAPGGAVTLPSGKVVHVYEDRTTAPDRIRCHTRNPDTTAWSSPVTVRDLVQSGDVNEYALPTLVVLPSGTRSAGRLLCFYMQTDANDATLHGLSMSYSDDEGATWTTGGDLLWTRTIAGNPYAMQAVYHRGYITILLSVSILGYHLVSEDLGVSWTTVENPTGSYYAPAVTASGEVLLFRGDDVLRKPGPFEQFSESSTVFETADGTANVVAAVVDDTGVAWVVRHKSGGTSTYQDELYLDALDTQTMTRLDWNRTDNSAGDPAHPLKFPAVAGATSVFDLGSQNWALTKYSAGLLLIAPGDGTSTSFATDYSSSLWAIELGGYDTLAWQSRSFGRVDANTSGVFYLPLDTPAALGWTAAGLGLASVSSITDGNFTGLAITPASTRAWYTEGAAGKNIIVSGRVRCNEATSYTVLRAERDDGATLNYRAEVKIGNGSIVLYNANGAASLATATVDTSKVWDVKLFVAGTRAALYYKAPTSRRWTEVGKGALTNLGASAVAASRVTWGILDGTLPAHEADWFYLGASMHQHGTATGFTSSDADLLSLYGFPVTPYTRGLYLDNGVRLRGKGGTMFNADTWTVRARYQYPVEACLYDANRSPSTGWRSADTTQQSIAFDLEGAGATFGCSSIGLALVGINFRTAYLEYSTDGTNWTTTLTFDAAAAMGTTIGYTVQGNTVAGRVVPSQATAAGGLTVEASELIGGTVLLGDTVAADVYATITANSEGAWRDPASSRAIDLRVEPRSGDDLALLTSPDTAQVWFPSGVHVRHNFAATPRYWRLRIPSQTTATGDFRIGALVIGGVVVFGLQNSWGRRLTLESNVDRVEDEAGRRYTRRRGPERRGVELSWVDPFDTTDLYGTTPDPDYVRARNNASYRGVALRGDSSVAEGIVRRSRAGELPVVYLPAIPIATSGADEFGIFGQVRWLYGEVVGEVSRTSILGNEASSELLSVDAIRIEELV